MRTVARSKEVGRDKVAEALLAISERDLAVKRSKWTENGEKKNIQKLVIFVWYSYMACPKAGTIDLPRPDPVNRGTKPALIPILYWSVQGADNICKPSSSHSIPTFSIVDHSRQNLKHHLVRCSTYGSATECGSRTRGRALELLETEDGLVLHAYPVSYEFSVSC